MSKLSCLKVVSIFFCAIGFYLLMNSPALGSDAASEYLREEMYGQMDSESFNIIKQSYIDAYRLAGGIFLSVGSFYAFKFFSKGDL
ncbi:hypothetical protein [Brevibacillus migulae]|uniref:hypothetical protein n=1 Tax=Brevibacillus migulae TaxID=1644114 RepID=UPI00106E3C83|nr:hypothetical protein [Brevibacillus migulae]